MTRKVLWEKVEDSDEMNFQYVLLCNFPPAVISTPDVNTQAAGLIHPRLSFWPASVLKECGAKGI